MHPLTLFAAEDYKEPSRPPTQLRNLHMHVLRRLTLTVLPIISTMLAFVSQTSHETVMSFIGGNLLEYNKRKGVS